VIYGMLGELEIRKDGRLLSLPAGPTLVLFAALLLNANRQVSKNDLIRAAWGDEEVREAQLHKRVMAVREALASIGRREDIRTLTRYGYELRVAEDDVDALLFRRLIHAADEAGAERRTDDEIDYLRRALSLWRGPHPLANIPGQPFLQETAALEQRHKRAAVRLFGLELARGNHERILDEIMLVAGYYPTDRRLCEQLMTAEYRCGHLTDVTVAYERYRDRLDDELGGMPDPLLRSFHFAIARGDQTAIATAESAIVNRAGAPARPAPAVPMQLPRPTDLVGRDELIAEAAGLLRAARRLAAPVIVISGPGGIGKTALALHVSHHVIDHYPDGQLYVELHGTTGDAMATNEILGQLLHAFGVPRIPDTTAERLAVYRTVLASRRMLIVLDDAADGAQVSELLPAGPGCAVVVTARRRMPEVCGAHHLPPLRPLDQEHATELFMRVVRDAGIHLDSDAAGTGQVVALCAGLPLAVRIAAALQVHDYPRSAMELANRLARQGPAAFVYRDLSIARTIGVGFEQLDAVAQQLFLELGLLRLTGFGLWTVAALLDGAGADAAATAMSQLAAGFMVESMDADMRYRFHELTREYARHRALTELSASQTEAPGKVYLALLTLVRRAHADLYGSDFEVVHSAVPDWGAPPEVLAEIDAAPLDWFERERLNIRAAVEHCASLGLVSICWDLAVSTHEFYTIRGYFDDWYVTHTIALRACRAANDRLGVGIVLVCLNQSALLASRRSSTVSGLLELRQAVDLLAESGDRHGEAIALRALANAMRGRGRLTDALELFNAAAEHYKASGDMAGQCQALRFIGQTHLNLGNPGPALHSLRIAESIAATFKGPRLLAQVHYWIGQACLAGSDLRGAQAAFDAVFDVFCDDTGIGHAYALHGLGDLAWRQGRFGVAHQHLSIAAELANDGADTVLEGRVWLSIAALCRAQGQAEDQLVALRNAVATFSECSATYLEVRALAELAEASAEHGVMAEAAAAWTRIARLYADAELPESDRVHRPPSVTPGSPSAAVG